jgi:hypothetical protein
MELPFETHRTAPFAPVVSAWAVASASPTNLLVTDPRGRRAGFDAWSGEVLKEIPNAVVTSAGVEAQFVIVPDPVPGEYAVTTIGYGEVDEPRPYSVEVHRIGTGGDVSLDVFSGTTTPGQGDAYAVTVNVNTPPSPADDSYVLEVGEHLRVEAPGVLGNDVDIDGESLTAILLDPPSNGVVQLGADGSFTYAPLERLLDTVSFSYAVSDGAEMSSPAIVSIVPSVLPDGRKICLDEDYDPDLGTSRYLLWSNAKVFHDAGAPSEQSTPGTCGALGAYRFELEGQLVLRTGPLPAGGDYVVKIQAYIEAAQGSLGALKLTVNQKEYVVQARAGAWRQSLPIEITLDAGDNRILVESSTKNTLWIERLGIRKESRASQSTKPSGATADDHR